MVDRNCKIQSDLHESQNLGVFWIAEFESGIKLVLFFFFRYFKLFWCETMKKFRIRWKLTDYGTWGGGSLWWGGYNYFMWLFLLLCTFLLFCDFSYEFRVVFDAKGLSKDRKSYEIFFPPHSGLKRPKSWPKFEQRLYFLKNWYL